MITSPSNVEGTNDLTNSSRGSRTPPWLHHAGQTMAVEAWHCNTQKFHHLKMLATIKFFSKVNEFE
jgi:hypothetical protein